MEYSLSKLYNILLHVTFFGFVFLLILLTIMPFIIIPSSECGIGIIVIFPFYCVIVAIVIWLYRIINNIHKQNCKSVYIDLNNNKLRLKLNNGNNLNIPFTEITNVTVKIGYIVLRGTLYDVRSCDVGDIKIETIDGKIYSIMSEFAIEFYEDFPIEYKKNLIKQYLYNP